MKKIIIILNLIFSISGCSTLDKGNAVFDISSQFPLLKAGHGRVIIYRKSSAFSAIANRLFMPPVTINGQTIGGSYPGEYYYIDLPIGSYTIGHRKEAFIGFSKTKIESRTREALELREGQIIYIAMVLNTKALFMNIHYGSTPPDDLSKYEQAFGTLKTLK